jgi:tungstate transport system permease protein
MSEIIEGVQSVLALLSSGDAAIWSVVALSLWVSGMALLLSALLGIPCGAWLGLHSFRGRRLLTTLVYTGMSLPPVVAGLFVYLLLSRAGPLGPLGWLFTPRAMIMAQTVISFPLVTGLTMAAVESIGPDLRAQLRALGATPLQLAGTVLWEARTGMFVALAVGFGRVISEVGAVMLVGGNIEGATRVLTTAIVLETRKGAFDQALALAFVLLALAFSFHAVALRLQGRLHRVA